MKHDGEPERVRFTNGSKEKWREKDQLRFTLPPRKTAAEHLLTAKQQVRQIGGRGVDALLLDVLCNHLWAINADRKTMTLYSSRFSAAGLPAR